MALWWRWRVVVMLPDVVRMHDMLCASAKGALPSMSSRLKIFSGSSEPKVGGSIGSARRVRAQPAYRIPYAHARACRLRVGGRESGNAEVSARRSPRR